MKGDVSFDDINTGLEDLASLPFEHTPEVPTSQEIEEVFGQKKSIFSKFFGKKQKADVPVPDKVEERKHEVYVDKLHRRLDMEMRERQRHARQHESELDEKKKDVEKRVAAIEKKEKELAKLENVHREHKQLSHELEDKKITLDHKDEQIRDLKKQLDDPKNEPKEELKDIPPPPVDTSALDGLKEEIDQMRKDHDQEREKLEEQLKSKDDEIQQLTRTIDDLKIRVDEASVSSETQSKQAIEQVQGVADKQIRMEDDAIEYLTSLLEKKHNEMDALGDVTKDMRERIEREMSNAMEMLEADNVQQAKHSYSQARGLYTQLKDELGQDEPLLYHKLVDVFKAISDKA